MDIRTRIFSFEYSNSNIFPLKFRDAPNLRQGSRIKKLFDLAFLEFHVLADHGVVFLDHHLFRLGTRVFLGHIVVTGVSTAHQPDLNG